MPIFGYYMTVDGDMVAVNIGGIVKKAATTKIKVNDLVSQGIKHTDTIFDGYDNPMAYKDGGLVILNLRSKIDLPILGQTRLLTKGAI